MWKMINLSTKCHNVKKATLSPFAKYFCLYNYMHAYKYIHTYRSDSAYTTSILENIKYNMYAIFRGLQPVRRTNVCMKNR